MHKVQLDPQFALVDSVTISLSGDVTGNPNNPVRKYLDVAQDSLDNAGMRIISAVSSWAIVVDITWKASFTPVRKQGASPSVNEFAPVGTIGDTIAVIVNAEQASY